MDFEKFDKIPRYFRGSILTEKLDGTNAQITIATYTKEYLTDVGRGILAGAMYFQVDATPELETAIWAGSRNRWLSLANKNGDNHGFARWVFENATELIAGLGPGRHYGEWYGNGIGRNYGLDHKRLALFNTTRWDLNTWTEFVYNPWVKENEDMELRGKKHPKRMPTFQAPPKCCTVVPILTTGIFDSDLVSYTMTDLRRHGSRAVPGYMKPEGVVVYHTQSQHLFKATFDFDEGKWNV